jgi:iron complex outermembrane recepter protein
MPKSFWMLSAAAAAVAIATPAVARNSAGAAQPAPPPASDAGATAQSGAVAGQPGTQPVSQQATNDQADEGAIIITANRRNQALSDVPIAVSAVTGDQLHNSGAHDIRQLTQLAPSLLVSSTSSEAGAGTARIRGVGTVGDNPGLESSVAVFIDGVYRSRNGTALTELGPIDRIEVLRGPQGTLFGRNASAGLISIITAKPSFTDQMAGELEFGNYNERRAELGITGPMSQTLAYRIDAVYLARDGFLKDVVSGRRINDRSRFLIRGQLLYEPNENLSFRLIADYTSRKEECCGASYLPGSNKVLANSQIVSQPSSIEGIIRGLGGIIDDNTYDRRTALTPGVGYAQNVTDYGFSGELNYKMGSATLTSITAYRSNDYVRGQDADFTNLDILRRNADGNSDQRFRTFSEELRLQGEAFDGKLNWLVGGYYANEKLHLTDNLQYGSDYERFANCLLFAAVLPSAVAPTPGGTCVNVPVVQGTIAALNTLPAGNPLRANIPLLSALIANPARPGFGSIAAALGQPALGLNGTGLNDVFNQRSNNFAVFTHNIISLTDRLKLTLGLRYTTETKTLDANLSDNNPLCSLIGASPFAALNQLPCVIPSVPGGHFVQTGQKDTENALSGTAVLSYKPIDHLLTYASYSRGYKAGGFNLDRSALSRQGGSGPVLATANLSNLTFKPENVDSFEAGLKYASRFIDVNVTAFHEVFDNFQLNTFNGLFFIVENINSCSTSLNGADTDNDPTTGACTGKTRGGVVSQGVEVETFMRPMRSLGIDLGATLADTRYRHNLVGANGKPLTNALFQLPGREISNASKYTVTGSISYTPAIGDGLSALFYVDGRWQSRFNTGSDLDIEKTQPAYFVMNARIGIRGRGDRWGLEVWAQNLLNEKYMQVAFDAPVQGSGTTRAVQAGFTPVSTQLYAAFLADPRTFGITGRFRF